MENSYASELPELLEELAPHREEFEARVGRRVPDVDWRRLAAEYQLGLDVGLWIEDAVLLHQRWQAADTLSAPVRETVVVMPSEPSEDPRWSALAEILALEAGERPDVRGWREEFLPACEFLLDDGQATSIPAGHVYPVGYADIALRQLVSRGEWDRMKRQEARPPALARLRVPFRDHSGRERHVFALHDGGALEVLMRDVIAWVTAVYPWSEADAVTFVVTGKVPPYDYLVATTAVRDGRPATTRITIEFDPRMPWRDVKQMYELARDYLATREVLDSDSARPVKPGTAELALRLARRRDESFRELRDAWNGEHPAQSYATEREFARDAKNAYRRVVGARYERRERADVE